jgi:uroporphyrinogen decarboxylase
VTNRQRIIDTLLCKPTDRAPFAWWIGFMPWEQTLGRWREESGIADLDVRDYFGFEPYANHLHVELGPWPHFEQKVLRQDNEFVVSVEWRGMTVRNRRDQMSMPEFIRHPIAGVADWERYKAECLQPCFDQRLARLDEFAAHAAEVDAPVLVGHFPFGLFGTPRDLLGAERVLYGFYDQPDLIRDMRDTHVTLWLELYERVAQRVPIDHLHIWEDMAGKQGSLISMQMVEDFMMPHYDRLADFARRTACPSCRWTATGGWTSFCRS